MKNVRDHDRDSDHANDNGDYANDNGEHEKPGVSKSPLRQEVRSPPWRRSKRRSPTSTRQPSSAAPDCRCCCSRVEKTAVLGDLGRGAPFPRKAADGLLIR